MLTKSYPAAWLRPRLAAGHARAIGCASPGESFSRLETPDCSTRITSGQAVNRMRSKATAGLSHLRRTIESVDTELGDAAHHDLARLFAALLAADFGDWSVFFAATFDSCPRALCQFEDLSRQ